jgi:hypothetical protein
MHTKLPVKNSFRLGRVSRPVSDDVLLGNGRCLTMENRLPKDVESEKSKFGMSSSFIAGRGISGDVEGTCRVNQLT